CAITEPAVTFTSASKHEFVALSNITAAAWRGNFSHPVPAWTVSLGGSFSMTLTNRVVGVTLPASRRTCTAMATSAAERGSRGWRMGVVGEGGWKSMIHRLHRRHRFQKGVTGRSRVVTTRGSGRSKPHEKAL